MFVPRFLTGTTGTGTAFRQSQMAEAKSFLYQAPNDILISSQGGQSSLRYRGRLRIYRAIPPNAMKNIEGKILFFARFFVSLPSVRGVSPNPKSV